MRKIIIDCNCTYADMVKQIIALKQQYDTFLASFSFFEMKAKTKFMAETRNAFYSLKFEEWKIDKLWSFMNGDEQYTTIVHIK